MGPQQWAKISKIAETVSGLAPTVEYIKETVEFIRDNFQSKEVCEKIQALMCVEIADAKSVARGVKEKVESMQLQAGPEKKSQKESSGLSQKKKDLIREVAKAIGYIGASLIAAAAAL